MILPLFALYTVATGCIPVQGEHITAADMARAFPVFSSAAPSTSAGLTPLPGVQRILHPADLARFAKKLGLETGAVDWSNGACFEYETHPVQPEQLTAALRAALGMERGAVELVEHSAWPIPPGRIEFSVSTSLPRPDPHTGAILFRGRVHYAERRSIAIWVRARLQVERDAVVAAVDLPAGKLIEPDQLRVERVTEPSPFPDPTHDPSTLAGLTPRRDIPAGSEIDRRLLVAPRLVEPGDTVHVEVQSGVARLTLPARAESGGRAGDLILVRNEATGRRFKATIDGPGRVVVNAGEEN